MLYKKGSSMHTIQKTEEKILQAAAELFAERGYAASATRVIAEKAGVNEVTLFRRFKNKAGILQALGEKMTEEYSRTFHRAGVARGTAKEILSNFALQEIESAEKNGGLAIRLAFDAQSIPEVKKSLEHNLPRNFEYLTRFMADHQKEGSLRKDIEPQVLAEAFLGLTSSYVMYKKVMGKGKNPARPEKRDRAVKQLLELFWTGASAETNTGEKIENQQKP